MVDSVRGQQMQREEWAGDADGEHHTHAHAQPRCVCVHFSSAQGGGGRTPSRVSGGTGRVAVCMERRGCPLSHVAHRLSALSGRPDTHCLSSLALCLTAVSLLPFFSLVLADDAFD